MSGHLYQPAYGEESRIQSDQDVRQMLQRIRTDPRTDNPQVLGINMRNMALAKNNGYPLFMYHETLAPEMVLNEKEEEAMSRAKFQRQYIPRAFPAMMYRRNMSDRFAPQIDPATKMDRTDLTPYVEERVCKTEDELKRVLAEKTPKGCSDWFPRLALLPDLDEGPDEDPAVTQARLQGQIDALTSQLAAVTPQATGEAKRK